MNFKEVFSSLLYHAYSWAHMRASRRSAYSDHDKPGDMIKALPNEARAALQELKSDDISSEKLSQEELSIALLSSHYDREDRELQNAKEEKIKFDKRILKDGSRRRKYDY